jgi:hypothetical protein
MAQGVGADVNLTDEALRELHIITQLKYSCSHVATFLLAIGLPKRDLLSWIVTVLLFLFPVLSTIAFAYEPAIMARLLLMWLLLALGGWLTLRESRKIQGDH